MKVTIYALHLGVGGVEKYVSTIANMLSEQHQVEIISTYKMQKVPAFDLKSNVQVEYLIEGLKPNREQILTALRMKRPIVLMSEICKAIRILVLKYYKNISSIKRCKSDVIISTRIFHNNIIKKYAKPGIVKITGEHNHHNNNKKYIKKVLRSCEGFDFFIPISKELYEFYYEPMKERGVTSKYIRYCIDDIGKIEKPQFNRPDLIYIGRLSKEKGVCELLKVFRQVSNNNKDSVLHVVGDGPELGEMNKMVKTWKMEDRIVFHGFKEKEYIFKLLSECSLYVMTSYTESFGIVLLEAMACGIPCIAYTSAQGAKEIIENGANGYLIEGRNRNEMVDRINKLLASSNTLKQFSEQALKTTELFSYTHTKDEWLYFMSEIEKRKYENQ